MRTRFAPSPTGRLHLGHAYAAWFAWNEALRAGGEFLLRIEDIDGPRCRPEFEAGIFEDLRWLGMSWQEPVWRQSDRLAAYREALDQLDKLGVLYPCFCTRQEINAHLSAPQGPEGPLYPGTCRALTRYERDDRLERGLPHALRLNVVKASRLAGPLIWSDAARGEIPARPGILGDVVLARKDIPVSYHLAVTVDDAAQGIDLVTRGEDLLPSTHIHRLLQALLGLPVPTWKHHHLICDLDGKRLAKRDEARSLASLRERGHSPADILDMAGA